MSRRGRRRRTAAPVPNLPDPETQRRAERWLRSGLVDPVQHPVESPGVESVQQDDFVEIAVGDRTLLVAFYSVAAVQSVG